MRRQLHRVLATALSTTAVVGGLLAAAPATGAATTSSCTSGFVYSKLKGWLYGSFSAALSDCSFTDTGAPYTIDVATMSVSAVFVSPPINYKVYDVVATCPEVTVKKDSLNPSLCTYTYSFTPTAR